MRLGARTLVLLALCAAAAAAAIAHVAIDVLGDYALARDSYDNLRHGSRELVSGLALMLALVLAARGLRICFEIAAANRARILRPVHRLSEAIAFVLTAVAAAAMMVPAMEWLDGRLGDVPVQRLDDAFGGSLLLGLGTTIVFTAAVATVVYGIARWLISHRDSIATIIVTLLRHSSETSRPTTYQTAHQRIAPRRQRTLHALRLSKRGPPVANFA
ncbi:MAG TPA: hypothetical protein VFE35_08145 [Candidatus Cybelea sp.]|nr:hypothetical protein [Candidatus Cybelea sp.]